MPRNLFSGVIPMRDTALCWSDIARPVELRTRDLNALGALRGPAAVDEVLRILRELQEVFDGSGCPAAGFNHLYVATTTQVAERLAAAAFRAPDFVCALDLQFALRYLAAVRGMATGDDDVPRSWQVALDPDEDASPLARMAASVNAHVNFDLPFALLAAVRDAASFPAGPRDLFDDIFDAAEPGDEYHDYAAVNGIFHELLPQALDFATAHDGFLRWLYRLGGVRDDAELLITAARRMAWVVCENHLWPLRAAEPRALRRRERRIDWLVSRLGAEMLGPAGELAFGAPDRPNGIVAA
jgi:Family of unknown function (DUF5995)